MASQYLTFEGQFENNVLGTFRLIRGFANLKDLAEVSVPFQMVDTSNGVVDGHQRELVPEHAKEIRRYLERGDRRFLPEVILSVRTTLIDELGADQRAIGVRSDGADGIDVQRLWKSRNIRVHRMRVDRRRLDEIRASRAIRRVDGNHRLALAEQLEDDPRLASKYLGSFCLVLLGPPHDPADDYSESMIFHSINSTALPLESEHALRLILGQGEGYDIAPAREFAFNPELHLTRLLRNGVLDLPEPAQTRLGAKPLTSLSGVAKALLGLRPDAGADLESMNAFAKELLAALNDIVTRLEPANPGLCRAEFFIELAARSWERTSPQASHAVRVNDVVAHLEQLGAWLGTDGLLHLKSGDSLSEQVIDIFDVVRSRMPRRVFLARWYPSAKDGDDLKMADLRLAQIRVALRELADDDVHLELVDMGTQTGPTFPIQSRMYEAITSADIILIDLTGVRPNVCIEAGFALQGHEQGRLIFMFQPSDAHPRVPFDLATFRYEPFTDTAEIPGKLKPHLKEIVRSAARGD